MKNKRKKNTRTKRATKPKLADLLIPGGVRMKGSIKKIANMYPLVIFVKQGCPYCKNALSIMESEGATPKIITLYGENGRRTQNFLKEITGRRTVPNVFVGGKSIGGASETTIKYNNGQLTPMLTVAGVVLKNNFNIFG
jgi:glutaredoxin 3